MSTTGPWLQTLVSDWLSGATVKAMLVTSAYVQDVDNDTVPTSFEVSGTGYTAGGLDVTSLLSVSYDTSTNSLRLLCGDVAFGTVDLADVGGIAFYAGTHLVAVDTFSPVEVSSEALTYRPSTDGLVVAAIA